MKIISTEALVTCAATLVIGLAPAQGQCTCAYTFTGSTDTLVFLNQSIVSNAHYYWNFGDGSTSYAQSPTHIFSESGKYLVTLYGRDTLSNCHTYYEEWIDVVKPSSDPCQPMLGDSIFTYQGTDYIMFIDSSMNCGGYQPSIDFALGGTSPGNWEYLDGWWGAGLWSERIRYFTHDSITGYVPRREYYRTRPNNYDSNVNYDSCSANFEYSVDYQADGAMVTLTAMNPAGVDTFYLNNAMSAGLHSFSQLLPYSPYNRSSPWIVEHFNTNGSCETHCTQTIYIQNPNYVIPPTCAFIQPPHDVSVTIGEDAQFIIETDPGVTRQWQQDAGLGWQDLTNAGPFSGVQTDTLTVANCYGWMNNYHYRCMLSSYLSYCHNTSDVAVLSVGPAGIEENTLRTMVLQPNPASDHFTVTLPDPVPYAQLRILSMTGQVEHTAMLSERRSMVDVSGLSVGMHVVEVIDGPLIARRKFVKEQ